MNDTTVFSSRSIYLFGFELERLFITAPMEFWCFCLKKEATTNKQTNKYETWIQCMTGAERKLSLPSEYSFFGSSITFIITNIYRRMCCHFIAENGNENGKRVKCCFFAATNRYKYLSYDCNLVLLFNILRWYLAESPNYLCVRTIRMLQTNAANAALADITSILLEHLSKKVNDENWYTSHSVFSSSINRLDIQLGVASPFYSFYGYTLANSFEFEYISLTSHLREYKYVWLRRWDSIFYKRMV